MISYTRHYKPAPFIPTISRAGDEERVIIAGENMWVRSSRAGSLYAEGYTGNLDLSENIATKTLTGTLAWDSTTKTVTGTGTAFLSEVGRPGVMILGDGGAGVTQLLVVEKIISDTSLTISRKPTATASGKTGYVLPVIFPVGTDRGTCIRGNVVQFPTGHYLGVGDGTFRVNGTALSATLALSTLPQFALFNPTTGLYVQDNVGISTPAAPPTVAAVSRVAITDSSNATPINIHAVAHGLITGDKALIGGHLVNTSANGFWSVIRIDADNFTLTGSVGVGVGGATGYLWPSQMQAGDYNIRICAKSTSTLGFSQPTDVIAPVTLTANQSIRVTFNTTMATDQDAYDIYATPFEDNSTATIQARYMGPWFLLNGTNTTSNATVIAADLIDAGHATGRETGTNYVLSFADAEIQTSTQVLTFNNFSPVKSEFVDLITGIPIYFSCLGKGNASNTGGTSPGPAAIPAKPSNPEAVFLNKTITTAGGDYILGEFNAKSRIFVLGQNTLQTLILTTLEDEPITFRSLWNVGFRNPYNAVFVKEYIYAFSTQKIVRSVAGGDDSAVEFEFTSDIRDYIINWETGHVVTGYDPKNKAVIFFYSAAERRSGYWVTIALPFLIDKGIWNPPIVLFKTNTDFIVSGVATVGEKLYFLAGGRTSGGSIVVGTYEFDGGDSETKNWYLAWNYSDDEQDLNAKTVKGFTATGKFAHATNTLFKVYGLRSQGGYDTFDTASLTDGTNASASFVVGTTGGYFARKRFKFMDTNAYPNYAIRMEGSYTTTADRLDEVVVKLDVNSSER